MSVFGNIMDRIFNRGRAKAAAPGGSGPTSGPPPPAPAPPAGTPQTELSDPAPAVTIDVGAVLSEMATLKGGGGNYQSSIVDLLKLLDLDSSLQARKELADELGVTAVEAGSAEQNIALHRAVMNKLAENGGVVPETLRD